MKKLFALLLAMMLYSLSQLAEITTRPIPIRITPVLLSPTIKVEANVFRLPIISTTTMISVKNG